MRTGHLRIKRTLLATAGTAALALTATAAQADAQGQSNDWHAGFYGQNAIVTGQITGVNSSGSGSSSTSSFTANAYVVTPGAGNASTPTETPVTITEGANTKVSVLGQSGLQTGDTFYATYAGQSSQTPITTLVNGTPSKIFAFLAPTPQVEVQGIITQAPTTSDPNQFTATAYIAQPVSQSQGTSFSGNGPQWGGGYSYGGNVGGSYGSGGKYSSYDFGGSYGQGAYGGFNHSRGFAKLAHCNTSTTTTTSTTSGTSTTDYTGYTSNNGDSAAISKEANADGTPGTVIDLSDTTTYDINGNSSSSVSGLQAGQTFTAVLDGTPDETLANLVNDNPALSVDATTPNELYGFVGTVTAVTPDSSTGGGTVAVDVADSSPTGLFTGIDTFDVGPNTFVFGGPQGSLWGSLSNVSVGDVVAGGLIGLGGQTASAVEAEPLQVLVDFPVPNSSDATTTSTGTTTTPTTTTTTSSVTSSAIKRLRKRDIKKGLALLGKDLKKSKSVKKTTPTKKHKH